MAPGVGDDIESICGKCGDVWHVVAAKVSEKIVKVVCKQCGAQHRHRPPGGPPAKSTVKRATGATPRATGARTSRARSTVRPVSAEPLVNPNLAIPTRPYRIGDTYVPGERIDHPKFGSGIVESQVGRGKIQVWFADQRRVLVHEHQPQ